MPKLRSPEAEDRREHHYLDRMSHHNLNYPEFHWPSVEALLNLIYTRDVVEARVCRTVNKYGLSKAAFNALMILSRCGRKGCPMRELSELMLVTRANITGLIDSLEKKNLVERTDSKKDRRICITRITKKGEVLLENILPEHYTAVREVFAGLTKTEKATISALLTKLRRAIQNADQAGRI
jgi:MarR family 2-MHQ and catechol resistance regulon transcriptional repressor